MLKTAVDEFHAQRSHDSEKSEHVSTSDLRELFLGKIVVRNIRNAPLPNWNIGKVCCVCLEAATRLMENYR